MIDPKKEVETAISLARRAIDIEREDASVLAWAALTLAMFADEFDAAVPILDQALQLNPNMMVVHLLNGAIRGWLGQAELAVEHYFTALRLSPYDTLGFSTLSGLAAGHFLLGKNDEALVWIDKALANNPRIVSTLRWAAAINASTGHVEKSIIFARRLLELSPEENITRTVARYRKSEHRQKIVEALRIAQVPE